MTRAAAAVLSALLLVAACSSDQRQEQPTTWVRLNSMADAGDDPTSDLSQCLYNSQGPASPGPSIGRGGRTGINAPGHRRQSLERCMRDRGWKPGAPPDS